MDKYAEMRRVRDVLSVVETAIGQIKATGPVNDKNGNYAAGRDNVCVRYTLRNLEMASVWLRDALVAIESSIVEQAVSA